MRIIVCAAFYPPYRGGYAESVRLLAEGLHARGHAVTVIASDAGSEPESPVVRGVTVRRVPAWNPSFLQESFPIPRPFAFWRELARARTEGVDILSTQTRFFPSTFFGFLFAKFYGIPTFHTERGAAHTHSDSFLIRMCAKIVDHTVGQLVCRFSDGTIGVSDAACAFMRRLGAHNPVTVHNGINADWWRRPDTFVRADGFLRIVFIGRLVHAKGVGDLLLALPRLVIKFPALRVSIIGDGPYRGTLERQVRALGLLHAIIFHGALDSGGIRDIVWQSDIAVNPSHCEGFPRSVLETAAAGLPTVATDTGGTREIVEDGVSGLLVKERDIPALTAALARLLKDAPLRARMGVAAALRSRRFSVESMVQAYEKNFASHAVL